MFFVLICTYNSYVRIIILYVCAFPSGLLSQWSHAGSHGGGHRQTGAGWQGDDQTGRVRS